LRTQNGATDQGVTINVWLGLAAMALLILTNAIFVAGEFALVALDGAKAENAVADGRRGARLVVELRKRLSFHLSAAQLGITLSSLLLGVIAEPVVGGLLSPFFSLVGWEGAEGSTLSIIIILLIASGVQMVLGELIPKSIAVASPLATALRMAPLQHAFVLVAAPLVSLLDKLANRIVARLGFTLLDEHQQSHSVDEYQRLLDASVDAGEIGKQLADLLQRSLHFADKSAASAMTPRTSVVAVTPETTLDELRAVSVDSGKSRLLVRGESLDEVLGVAHVSDIFATPADERSQVTVGEITTPAFVVPESRNLASLLAELREGRNHLALVVDEYGGTAGVITLEDLLEEIVGEIYDEHDDVLPMTTSRWGSQVLDGSLHIDEVDELVGLSLPKGEYETLAGYVLVLLGDIPAGGEVVEANGWRFEVIAMDRHRIAQIAVQALQPNGDKP
jgi:magnesium and cobalt exporter, CNNM family